MSSNYILSKKDLIGYKWAKDIVEGRFIANKYVKLECQRYIDRMQKYPKGYFFSYREITFIYSLLSFIKYSTGDYRNQPIISHITGFQAMIIENIFGWLSVEDRMRMIDDVVLLVGRKSGKSVLCVILEILLMLTGEKYEQHAIAGNTRDISGIVKRETEQIIKSSPYIAKHFKIQRDRIICKVNESFMRNLSSEANNQNGLLLSGAIIDEVGNLETHDLIGALRLSQMSTKNKLMVCISTAYNLEINAMKDLCNAHKRQLEGMSKENIHSFGLIFELDEGDDYTDEKNWIKASPLQMTLPNGRAFMRNEFQKALEVQEKMSEFRIKLLNEWISYDSSNPYILLRDFEKCRYSDEYNWYGRKVWIGLDVSTKDDNTSVAMVTYDEELGKHMAKVWAFIPSNKINSKTKKEKVDYNVMIENGLCYPCGEDRIDNKFIVDFILGLSDEYGVNIESVGYDPAFAEYIVERLEEEDVFTREIYQSTSNLHKCTQFLKDIVLDEEFLYEENELLDRNIINSREIVDPNLRIKLEKKKSRGKIDMIVALTFAIWAKIIDDKEGIVNATILDV
ncbi:MAG: hypothetical protein KIB00_16895 [Paeniclostridium sordellii]|nr:hypothetical protein [Paeniclostridium sordellii]